MRNYSEKDNINKIKCQDELKDIFNDNSDEDEEEKKLLEYYNKFKIPSDIV